MAHLMPALVPKRLFLQEFAKEIEKFKSEYKKKLDQCKLFAPPGALISLIFRVLKAPKTIVV